VRGLGVGQVERNVQQCKNGKPSLFLKWKLAPGRKRELGVWRVLYLSGRLTEVIREAHRSHQRRSVPYRGVRMVCALSMRGE